MKLHRIKADHQCLCIASVRHTAITLYFARRNPLWAIIEHET